MSLLDSSKEKPTMVTSGTVPIFMQYQIRFCKQPLGLNRSLTQRENWSSRVCQNVQWYDTDLPKQKWPKFTLRWERKLLFSKNCFCSPDWYLDAFIISPPTNRTQERKLTQRSFVLGIIEILHISPRGDFCRDFSTVNWRSTAGLIFSWQISTR